jgi:hypothetical protein
MVAVAKAVTPAFFLGVILSSRSDADDEDEDEESLLKRKNHS